MTRRRKPTPETASYLFMRRHDAIPAGHTVECGRCHSDRTFYRAIAPDPQRRTDVENQRMADEWLKFHPCVQTFATSARKMRAA